MSNMNSTSSERCVLCLDQKRSPVRIHCGHSFCYDCLDVYKSYRKYPWANKCPICRDVLREKKGTTKRKYSERNSPTFNRPNHSPIPATNLTSTLSIPQEQAIILEEFMALATDYDYDNNEQNSMEDLIEYEEDLTNESDSFRMQDNEYIDTEIDDDYDDDNDDNDDEYDIDFDDDFNGQPSYYFNEDNLDLRSSTNTNYYDVEDDDGDDNDDVMEVIDVDNESYVDDNEWFNTGSRNLLNLNNSVTDWESVIASDVIIID